MDNKRDPSPSSYERVVGAEWCVSLVTTARRNITTVVVVGSREMQLCIGDIIKVALCPAARVPFELFPVTSRI